MNERILKLADEAIEDMPGAWNIPDEFCKKFAELIVNETCSIVMGDKEISWADSIRISEIIREDFGVKE